jgi:hypothetical protein
MNSRKAMSEGELPLNGDVVAGQLTVFLSLQKVR